MGEKEERGSSLNQPLCSILWPSPVLLVLSASFGEVRDALWHRLRPQAQGPPYLPDYFSCKRESWASYHWPDSSGAQSSGMGWAASPNPGGPLSGPSVRISLGLPTSNLQQLGEWVGVELNLGGMVRMSLFFFHSITSFRYQTFFTHLVGPKGTGYRHIRNTASVFSNN